MPKKPTFPSTTLVDGLKTISSALDDIADASKTLAAREKRVQALVATLLRMMTGFEDQAALLKVQMAMQRENQVFTSVSNVLKTRRDTVKNAIGNVM
jgi:DNA uptake protein ComE-like DNA-binding protein